MKKIIIFLLLFYSSSSHAQKPVTNWDADEEFSQVCTYDLDLKKRTTEFINGDYRVLVNINDNGRGSFIWYMDSQRRDKKILTINDGYWKYSANKDPSLIMHCLNQNGANVTCAIQFEVNKDNRSMAISEVWINNENDNISLVFVK